MAKPDSPLDLWVEEVHQDVVGLRFKTGAVLFSGRSAFQQVDVIETAGHGRMLLNDGVVMFSERDEFVYHEMIAHVPLFTHPNPRRVLIIGGGDGGTAREVLRHRTVDHVTMVEIDQMVVDACREHIPSVAAAFDDSRLTLRIEDGVRFVAETDDRFDVVLVDSTDPVGPAEPLFNEAFYRGVANILTDNGIMVTQAESPFYDTDVQQSMLGNQRPFFPRLHIYLFSSLTYPGGLWSFGYASKGECPVSGFDPRRVRDAGMATRYYNAKIHRAAFLLPSFVEQALAGILDSVPDPFQEGI